MYIAGDTLLFWLVIIVIASIVFGFERGKRAGRQERDVEIAERAYFETEFPKVLASWPEDLRNKFQAELDKQREMR